ncbi:TetR/AcrR family transcriptional regulator [Paractinoplanes atraurantiacus]|uniref:TetR/AcrR family transcriptional regulator n=1 Tax=Paractinoplanes atraurantiacus TaxID=1036182 RepID=UPI000BE37492|nr:TetR/AcrR family transcriptional regulator [Actinoplanes atraurantiacus]
MPKLWDATIESHRQVVHQAILDVTAALVRAHGPAAVSMSQIAKDAGIGRATLYKYFPDVTAIVTAWQEQQIARHLDRLAAAGETQQDPAVRLTATLTAYASAIHAHHDDKLFALVHSNDHAGRAQDKLRTFLAGVIAEAAATGTVRTDAEPGHLADYCLFALAAAATMPDEAAVGKLVDIVHTGLRPG